MPIITNQEHDAVCLNCLFCEVHFRWRGADTFCRNCGAPGGAAARFFGRRRVPGDNVPTIKELRQQINEEGQFHHSAAPPIDRILRLFEQLDEAQAALRQRLAPLRRRRRKPVHQTARQAINFRRLKLSAAAALPGGHRLILPERRAQSAPAAHNPPQPQPRVPVPLTDHERDHFESEMDRITSALAAEFKSLHHSRIS